MSARTAAAVPVESGPDAGAPWHYGDPYAEELALESGQALVDLSHRPVLRVAGADRLTWLHALTTQHLTDLAPHAWTQALVLSPQGHVEHHLTLVDDGEQVLAHVEPGTARRAAGLPALDGLLVRGRAERRVGGPRRRTVRGRRPVRPARGPRGRAGRRARPRRAVGGRGAAGRATGSRGCTWTPTTGRCPPRSAGWARHAGAPGQGLLPRAGVGRARAQPGPAAAPSRAAPAGRLDQRRCPRTATRSSTRPTAAAVGFVGTAARDRELGPIALALVKRNVADGSTLLAGADDGARVSALVETPPAQQAAQQGEPAAAATVQGWRAAARTAKRPPGPADAAAAEGAAAGGADSDGSA